MLKLHFGVESAKLPRAYKRNAIYHKKFSKLGIIVGFYWG